MFIDRKEVCVSAALAAFVEAAAGGGAGDGGDDDEDDDCECVTEKKIPSGSGHTVHPSMGAGWEV